MLHQRWHPQVKLLTHSAHRAKRCCMSRPAKRSQIDASRGNFWHLCFLEFDLVRRAPGRRVQAQCFGAPPSWTGIRKRSGKKEKESKIQTLGSCVPLLVARPVLWLHAVSAQCCVFISCLSDWLLSRCWTYWLTGLTLITPQKWSSKALPGLRRKVSDVGSLAVSKIHDTQSVEMAKLNR